MKAKDLTGKRFGRWTVIGRPAVDKNGHRTWCCRCDCGRQHEAVAQGHLTGGRSTSCGCARSRPRHGATVGYCPTPEFNSWRGMIGRCTNPNHASYRIYGGRGISVSERWLKFECFLADMGKRPSGHSLERLRSDRGYEPGNCVWATAKQQARNTRRNRTITINGVSRLLVEWCDLYCIPSSLVCNRIAAGWSEEAAVVTP